MGNSSKKSIDVNSIVKKKDRDDDGDPLFGIVRGELTDRNRFFNHEIKITKSFIIFFSIFILLITGIGLLFFYNPDGIVQFILVKN